MPEGPEVKRITERINDFFQDTTLESIEVVVPRYGEKQLRGEVAEFQSALPLQIESVQCKGKFIYFTLENGWTVWNTLHEDQVQAEIDTARSLRYGLDNEEVE